MSIKKEQQNNKTITAIATPVGIGGVGIIRLSGENSLELAQRIFSKKVELLPRFLTNIKIKTDSVNDNAMAVYFKAPNSFTGEDVVELHLHGNYLLLQKVVEELIKCGASMAEPGEFTKRAFLNGKLDLSGAEGLIDLINAKSISSINQAHNQLCGGLKEKIELLQKKLVTIIASASVAIDYPEEDLEESETQKIKSEILPIIEELEALKNSFNTGRIIREGVKVAIVGKPNVGKSMLLNALLGYDRSIVTSLAGTTRDTIEESFEYKGVLFNIIDTAGLREADNEVEKLGIERSKKCIDLADILLCVGTVSELFEIELLNNDDCDNNTTNNCRNKYQPSEPYKKTIIVFNKMDLLENANDKVLPKHSGCPLGHPLQCSNSCLATQKTLCSRRGRTPGVPQNSISISAKTGKNIDKLKELLYDQSVGKIDTSGVAINNNRQLTAVVNAYDTLQRIISEKQIINLDCTISDLNFALHHLNTITGAVALDEVVAEIFASFCVGK
ncbi:MAG: tRNA uridine-5-carboxymethylaminomethyl(34) synthesis GTPase MnmE [Firmicutes bacterium]|nr:tRNA uridine-5-carboxymethylaminomethyl(34) synthesis GTPase MnmE [Bacillota bacterium]